MSGRGLLKEEGGDKVSNKKTPTQTALESRKRERAMGGIILIAAFLALFNVSSVNVAVPRFMTEFKTSVTLVQWISIGYTLAMGVVSPLAGYFTRLFTLRGYFIMSMGAYVVLSIVSGLAPNIYLLVVVRAVQGLAGVALIPTTMIIIYSYIPRHRQSLYLTVQNMSLSLGPALGPVIAGLILAVASWKWIFWFNVPLGLVAIFLAMHYLPKELADRSEKVDWLSFGLVAIGCLPVLLSFSLATNLGFSSPIVLGMLVGGSIFIVCFVRRQLKLENPVLDFTVMRNREYTLTLIGNALLSMGLALGPFIFAIYFQVVKGYSPLTMGLLLLIPAIFSVGGAPVAQAMYDRMPSKTVIILGWIAIVIGSVTLGFMKLTTPIAVAMIFFCFRYLGIGLLGMPITDHGMRELPKASSDDGSTLINWVKLMITGLSLSVFTLLYERVTAFFSGSMSVQGATLMGVDAVFLSSGITCVVGLVLSLMLKRVHPKED
ncbi:drug resistance transporter, EmrB/QacA subfamily [Peptococcus niger]|uniref:Drug resistance transporter, EmrB/QacA subfamily n=1 Tax=Peptococcus niger TaxID=2741 RepID=A0A1G6YQV9_PEPNI|nr:drug resistance transporter, EmrB/QacA subfamily [Peptococcus niger]